MRRILMIVCGVIVVVVLGGIIAWNSLPSLVSHSLSKRAKVPVSIANIRLLSPGIEVKKIHVKNPPNSILSTALEVETLRVNTPMKRFFDDNIVIDLMTLDDVYLGLEFESQMSTKGNWSTIMKNLKESTGEEKEKGKKTSVLIKKLIITNLNIDLVYRQGNRRIRKLRPIERLELNNISSEGGIPTAQIMDIIMTEMLRSVFSQEGLKNMLEGIFSPPGDGGGVEKTIKGLFSDLIELDNDGDVLYDAM